MLHAVIAMAILLATVAAHAEPREQQRQHAQASGGTTTVPKANATAGTDATEAAVLSGLEEMCRAEGWGYWWDGQRCLTNEETLSLSREEALKLIRWRYRGGQTF